MDKLKARHAKQDAAQTVADGAFMQGGDDRRYVAQVNADIGDAGSLYVTSSDGHLGAEIQMG